MYGFHQIKDFFKKSKWIVLIVTWSAVFVYFHFYQISKNNTNSVKEVPGKPAVKYYDVVLNSYMQSGSTLTGIILGWREDTFYLYEPLWKISMWTYWHGNNTVCRLDRPNCRMMEPGKAIQDKTFVNNKGRPSGSLVMAMKILRKLYDCLFNDFESTVLNLGVSVKLSGPSWNQISNCIKDKGIPIMCVQRFAPRKCKNAIHRVTKVLRLTTDLLGDLLKERNNLKVIHLFRDPRAIVNSRIHTAWYAAKQKGNVIADVQSLCNKMLYDAIEGKKQLKLYPDRFKFIYYEDLNENPLQKVRALYKYLGMSLDERKYSKVKHLSVFNNTNVNNDRKNNTAYWWRGSMSWHFVQKIDDICKDVYKELGYASIANEAALRNLSVRSVEMPKEYLLV